MKLENIGVTAIASSKWSVCEKISWINQELIKPRSHCTLRTLPAPQNWLHPKFSHQKLSIPNFSAWHPTFDGTRSY